LWIRNSARFSRVVKTDTINSVGFVFRKSLAAFLSPVAKMGAQVEDRRSPAIPPPALPTMLVRSRVPTTSLPWRTPPAISIDSPRPILHNVEDLYQRVVGVKALHADTIPEQARRKAYQFIQQTTRFVQPLFV
jgi:hypothetical protein